MKKSSIPRNQARTLAKIGAKIRVRRNELGLSLEALAEKVGISKMTLHRIETGATSPSIITLAEISFQLKQPLEAFIREGDANVVVLKKEHQNNIFDPEYGIRVVGPAGMVSDRIIITYAEMEEGTVVENHTNDGFEWALLIEGRAVVGVQGRDYPMEAGDAILYDAHFPHSITVEERIRYVNLFLKDD